MRTPLLSALLLGLLALGGCSLPQQQAGAPTEQRLGTQWGEGVASPVTSVALRRLSEQPVDRRQVFYSASRFDGRAIKELPLAKGRVGFAVLDEDGGKFDLVQHRSTLQLQGREGQRYRLWLNNLGNATYEVVATVDGLDVLNGQPGSLKNRGYVLEPGESLVIEGFRKNEREVAAFRFASPDDAYASNSAAGDDRRGPVRAGRSGQRSRGAGRRTAGISRRRPEQRRLRAATTLSRLRHLHENCAAAFLHKQSISQEPPMNRFSLPRPDARQCVAGLGFSALLLLASSANAAACRDITSVQQSADATRNTSMGGHVTQHIYGMTPPSGSSQKDKTLFKSRGNYDAAWRQYGYIDNPVACSGNSKFQVVSLEKLHMGKIDAYSCKQADGQGVCTRWDTYMAKEISYGFVLKDGKWILNTLYPVPLD